MRIRSESPESVMVRYKCSCSSCSRAFQIEINQLILQNSESLLRMTALVDTRPLALDGGSRSLQDILNVETIVEQPTADIDIPINKGAGLQDPRAEDDHIACGILDIIGRYQVYDKAFELNLDSRYKNTFMPLLVRMIRLRSCIELVLPAFPFKSPNSQDKVLGTLPDKAEEVSLALLQGMCDAIKGMYEPGAQLTIVSDGIVYNGMKPSCDEC